MNESKVTEKKTEPVNQVSAQELAVIISMYQKCTPEMKKCVNFFMQGLLLGKNI